MASICGKTFVSPLNPLVESILEKKTLSTTPRFPVSAIGDLQLPVLSLTIR